MSGKDTDEVAAELREHLEECLGDFDPAGHSVNVSAKSFGGTAFVTATVSKED